MHRLTCRQTLNSHPRSLLHKLYALGQLLQPCPTSVSSFQNGDNHCTLSGWYVKCVAQCQTHKCSINGSYLFFIIVIIILFSDFLQLPYPEPFCWKLASMLPLLFFPYSHAATFESLENWICQALLCTWRCKDSCWQKPPRGHFLGPGQHPFLPRRLVGFAHPRLLIAISCSFPHISFLLGSGRGEEKWTSIGAGRKQKESRSWGREIWVLDLALTMPFCFKMDMCAKWEISTQFQNPY